MNTSIELRRGQSILSTGKDSDILLGPTITAENLAAELQKYNVNPGSIAYNRTFYFDPTNINAIHVFLDADGKWYDATGTEVE